MSLDNPEANLLRHIKYHAAGALVGKIKGKKGVNCSDRRKSTKICIDDAKKVLIDFRYSAKLKFFPGARDMEKSKMAA